MSTYTLRQLREQAVLTQQEVADHLGVTDNTVSHWELGQRYPRAANIRKLAHLYDVHPHVILAALHESGVPPDKRHAVSDSAPVS